LLPGIKQEDSEDLIQIDELWVTAALFTDDAGDCAQDMKKEAQRRLKLYKTADGKKKAQEKGNMLVVFGKNDKVEDLKNLPADRNLTAGTLFTSICGERQADFEAFVHCPFHYIIKDAEGKEEVDCNDSSLILQVIIEDGHKQAKMLIGGDAGCSIWKTVNRKTKENKNTDRLIWDIFCVPHHGSYKFFTQKEHEEGREEAKDNPDADSMEILNRGTSGNYIVCSSRPVKEDNYDDEDPPHIEAVDHYKEKTTNFVCLMEYPDEDSPDPLVLRLTPGGLQKKALAAAAVITGQKAIGDTQRWG
jgi:hypothetical protein